jgi:hypothetical protein
MCHGEICNRIKLVYFLKFVVHTMKSEMMVLTGRQKANVADADVSVGWML